MTLEGGGGFDLDQVLEQELQRHAAQHPAPSTLHQQARYHAALTSGGAMTPLGHIASIVSAKAATGIAVATLAVAGAGAGSAAALTGSTSPDAWGKTVTDAVATCKADLKPGEHGIGQCVSAVAKKHGAEERAEHSKASPKPEDKDRDRDDRGKPAAKGTDGADSEAGSNRGPATTPSEPGHPATHPTPTATHPTGRPSPSGGSSTTGSDHRR